MAFGIKHFDLWPWWGALGAGSRWPGCILGHGERGESQGFRSRSVFQPLSQGYLQHSSSLRMPCCFSWTIYTESLVVWDSCHFWYPMRWPPSLAILLRNTGTIWAIYILCPGQSSCWSSLQQEVALCLSPEGPTPCYAGWCQCHVPPTLPQLSQDLSVPGRLKSRNKTQHHFHFRQEISFYASLLSKPIFSKFNYRYFSSHLTFHPVVQAENFESPAISKNGHKVLWFYFLSTSRISPRLSVPLLLTWIERVSSLSWSPSSSLPPFLSAHSTYWEDVPQMKSEHVTLLLKLFLAFCECRGKFFSMA